MRNPTTSRGRGRRAPHLVIALDKTRLGYILARIFLGTCVASWLQGSPFQIPLSLVHSLGPSLDCEEARKLFTLLTLDLLRVAQESVTGEETGNS
jgi:hypothetical protein